MPTITDTELINLKNALDDLNTIFAQINEGVYVEMGGSWPANIPASNVELETSASKEQDVADVILKLSDNLVWITEVVNNLFSLDENIVLGVAELEEAPTIKAPPEDPEPKE